MVTEDSYIDTYRDTDMYMFIRVAHDIHGLYISTAIYSIYFFVYPLSFGMHTCNVYPVQALAASSVCLLLLHC